jgi:hypothetical protein
MVYCRVGRLQQPRIFVDVQISQNQLHKQADHMTHLTFSFTFLSSITKISTLPPAQPSHGLLATIPHSSNSDLVQLSLYRYRLQYPSAFRG